MQPLAVDLNLLKAVLAPELNLSVGRELMVRVASTEAQGRAMLSLAGMLVEAELPEDVQAGDELRLQVTELTPDKVVLAIQDEEAPPTPAAQPAQQSQGTPLPLAQAQLVPMPQGGSLQVTDQQSNRSQAGANGSHTLTLRYDAPNLGPVDMRFALTDGALKVAVTLPAGPAYAAADEASDKLATSLTEATARPAKVTITPRRQPMEIFA